MDNNKTVTIKMVSPIDTPDGSYDLSYCVSVRSGATPVMMVDTVAHWLHAAEALAAGELHSNDEFTERAQYDESYHDQNRIVIFGDMKVFTASGLKPLPANVFCETTSAQDFINFAWIVMDGLGMIAKLPNVISFAGSTVATKPKSSSELDNHFGERKPDNTDNGGAVAAPKNIVGERPVFDYLGKEARVEIEQQYIGQVVGLQVGAVERKMHTFDSGDEAEQIMFWPPNGEYAYNYRTVITVDDRDNNYGLKTLKKAGILEQLPQVGYRIPMSGIAYFKLNKGKGDYADKVYWNFHSYVAGETAPQVPVDQSGEDRNEDEIPF